MHYDRAFHHKLALRTQPPNTAGHTNKANQTPAPRMVIHGLRGGATLARQLLSAGFELSFGPRHNADSYQLTPPHLRHQETDANPE